MIPLSLPNLSGKEWEYVKQCLDTGWISTAGSFVDRFELEFTKYLDIKGAVSVVNGTSALHISLKLLGVQNNDLVIMPNVNLICLLILFYKFNSLLNNIIVKCKV